MVFPSRLKMKIIRKIINWILSFFRSERESGIVIYRMVRECPGGFHSWVETNFGVIRKPNDKIPHEILYNKN